LSYAQKSMPALVNTTTFVVIVSVLVAVIELIATAAGRLIAPIVSAIEKNRFGQ
jgi:hypothetical protein